MGKLEKNLWLFVSLGMMVVFIKRTIPDADLATWYAGLVLAVVFWYIWLPKDEGDD